MDKLNYGVWLMSMIFIIMPFSFVGILLLVEDEARRKKLFIVGGLVGSCIFALLFFKYMNIEFVYGRELLDIWHANNPAVK